MKNIICLIVLSLLFSCSKESTTEEPKEVTTVTDIDGNVYNTVKIGTQIWMIENLKVTKYRNRDQIYNITDYTEWHNTQTGAYCWYNNDISNKNIYGALYNGYAIKDVRNLAPKGWHIPTETEWKTLFNYLGGMAVAGGKLKESGTIHWSSPNTGNNEVGFTALPGGYQEGSGYPMNGINYYGDWWSTSYDAQFTKLFVMFEINDTSSSIRQYIGGGSSGYSVRCIKD